MTINDSNWQFLHDATGLSLPFNEMYFRYLGDLGYTGTLTDRIAKSGLGMNPSGLKNPAAGGGVQTFSPINRYGIFDGDSRAASGQNSPDPTTALNVQRVQVGGMEFWVQTASGNKFVLMRNRALGGDDTAEWLANRAPVLASGAALFFDMIGVNDGTIDLATTKANRLQGIDDSIGVGGINMVPTDLPWTTVTGGDQSAGAIEHMNYVNWLKAGTPAVGRAGKVKFFDTFASALKGGTIMDYKDGYSDDGLHMNLKGNRAVGTAWGAAIKNDASIIWPGAHPAPLPTAAGGTVNSNPMLTGTTGTKSGAGVTGNVATSWILSQFNMAPATIVGSKDTDPDGYDRQIITIAGTPTTGANPSVTLTQSSAVGSGVSIAGMVPGAKLRAVARIYFADPAIASRVYSAGSVGIRVVGTIGGVAHTVQRIMGYQNSSLGYLEAGYDFPDGIMTPDLDIPAGMTVTSAFLEIVSGFGQNLPADCVIGISRAAWRIV